LSLKVGFGKELVVFGLDFGKIRIWEIGFWVDESCFWVVGFV